jgi:hypothetical protein
MSKILVFAVVFLLIGAFFIVSQQKLDLKEKQGQVTFLKSFGNWIGDIGKNTLTITANIIKLDWLPDTNSTVNSTAKNLTNSTNKSSSKKI